MENNNQAQQNGEPTLNHEHNLVYEINSIGMRCNICQWRYNPETFEYLPPLEDYNSPILG